MGDSIDFLQLSFRTGISDYCNYRARGRFPGWMDKSERNMWQKGYDYAKKLCR